jgi:Na+/proline symporter/signal transduction histidine kinase/ActR/RegA family two-component response regulator
MNDGWVIIALSLLYIGLLFGIAYLGDRAGRNRLAPSGRPYVYALALGVYCTSWTFLGSVGSAAAKGFDFIAVYVGPIIAFTLALPLLRRITRLTKSQNITSIADFIAARYGKNPAVAAIVTVIAVVGVLPYIALQLKAISQAIAVLLGHPALDANAVTLPVGNMDLVIAVVLAAFTILFGARHNDATEHQRGLMLAVAVESVVKISAFLLVGIYVVYGMNEGLGNLIETAMTQPDIANVFNTGIHGGALLTVSFLSFVCIILLPRQFHVTFVENVSEKELRKASWLFPLYLIAINIFVVPVAMAGSLMLGNAYPHDMYLLALPLYAKSQVFTFIAFLGGLSAATAMVVVETVALSIMLTNDLLMPLILKRPVMAVAGRPDMSGLLLNIRRAVMLFIILGAYACYDKIGNASLAEIGLLSFAAVAQFAPALFIGLFWRRATARGAAAGILAGFAFWGYTLLLPRLIGDTAAGAAFLNDGPFGLAFLRPEMLFYLNFDPFTHGVVWSLTVNVLAFLSVSLLRPLEPIERLQTNLFIEDANPYLSPAFKPWRTSVPFDELMSTVARYLGEERTSRAFGDYLASRGIDPSSPGQADPHAVKFTENLLASAIGAPSSRLVMSLMLRRLNVGRESALRLLDEASEAVQYNRDLLQCALDHVGQGIAVFDKKMQLICWNRQYREILMLPPLYARVGTPLDEIIRFKARRVHKDPAAVEEFVTDRIVKYQFTMEDFHECNMDGRVIETRVNAMPQGGVVVTYTDITERQAAAEALARANENLERRVEARTLELAIAKSKADEANISKTRFLAAASHDVLQPLNAARLYASSLLERSPPAELGRLARNIDASLDGVEEILNALLDISRLDSGAMKPEFGVFPVKDVLEQIRIDFEPIAKARGISFAIVPSSALIRSDRKLLRRILQNLVSNALKYNRDKGRVVLGCRRRGRNLIIEVHDSGPGIPDDQRDVIFKEFQRLDHHSHAPGLGLGLSIVERMCRVLDHRLFLKSELGKGSSFSVFVPLARWSEMESARHFPARPVSYGDLRGAIVLCVDNDRSIIDGMKALLSSWQCPVIAAMDSAEAIEQLKAARITPDIIISDYHLDRENGCDAIRTIAAACNADIPGIIVTADVPNEVRADAIAGGYAFLQKPVKPAALRALISSLIVQHQAAE